MNFEKSLMLIELVYSLLELTFYNLFKSFGEHSCLNSDLDTTDVSNLNRESLFQSCGKIQSRGEILLPIGNSD